MSFITGSATELIYGSTGVGTAKNTFTTEVQINDTAGMGVQCHLPPDFWLPSPISSGRGIHITARGILSSTGTPSFQLLVRSGVAGVTGPAILVSPSTTTVSGASNAPWELEADIMLVTMGATGANSTVRGVGILQSSGFATSIQGLYGNGSPPGNVTTWDTSVVNYISVNAACSVSNAANSIQLLQLLVFGLN